MWVKLCILSYLITWTVLTIYTVYYKQALFLSPFDIQFNYTGVQRDIFTNKGLCLIVLPWNLHLLVMLVLTRHTATVLQCVSRHRAPGTGLLWACFGTYCVHKGFYVTPSRAEFSFRSEILSNWLNNVAGRWSAKRKKLGSGDFSSIYRMSKNEFRLHSSIPFTIWLQFWP